MFYDLPFNSRNFILVYMFYRSSHQRYSTKIYLIIEQNSQEKDCVGVSFFIKVY